MEGRKEIRPVRWTRTLLGTGTTRCEELLLFRPCGVECAVCDCDVIEIVRFFYGNSSARFTLSTDGDVQLVIGPSFSPLGPCIFVFGCVVLSGKSVSLQRDQHDDIRVQFAEIVRHLAAFCMLSMLCSAMQWSLTVRLYSHYLRCCTILSREQLS